MNEVSLRGTMFAIAASLLEAKALTREFEGQVKALRGVDFSIKKASSLHCWTEGCGKSTLLHLLGALDRPTSGTLFYRGISLPDHPNPAAYRARQVGFIFQAFHLMPTFTAAENVQFRCSKSIAQLLSDAIAPSNC